MATILIHVDSETAQAFEAAPPQQKRRLELLAGISLRQALHETRSFDELLADLDHQIAASGISDAELEALLNDVD